MKLRRLLAALVVTLSLSGGSAYAAVIDLGFALDRSGSVGAANWTLVVGGLANALDLLPTSGANQYRVSVASFATTATVNVAPTIVTAANIAGIKAAITGIAFTGGVTCISCAATALTNAFIGDGGFGDTSLLNISTDGVPVQDPQPNGAVLRGTLVAAGWDSISAEAIGNFSLAYLQALVHPNPGVTTNNPALLPNPLVQGFVLQVADFASYEAAIAAKVQRIVNVPEPATMSLFGIALLGLGAARRRR